MDIFKKSIIHSLPPPLPDPATSLVSQAPLGWCSQPDVLGTPDGAWNLLYNDWMNTAFPSGSKDATDLSQNRSCFHVLSLMCG